LLKQWQKTKKSISQLPTQQTEKEKTLTREQDLKSKVQEIKNDSAKTFFSRRIRTKSCLSKAANLSSDKFKKLIQLLKIRFLRKLSSGLKRNLFR
jgi:hypothetical protein